MANLNRFVASGNITRDPETKVSKSGTAMLKFGLAVNEKHGDAEHVNFFECVVFGRYAEARRSPSLAACTTALGVTPAAATGALASRST